MKKVFLLLFMLCLASQAAFAQTFDAELNKSQLHILTKQDVMKQISQFPLSKELVADFKETKTIPALSRPLISKGKLFLEAGKGMMLERNSPFPMKTILVGGRIFQWVDGDKEPQEIKEAAAKMMAENLYAILSGQYDKLFDRFNVYGKTENTQWEVAIQPRLPFIQKYFSGLIVNGAKYINRIDIFENGTTHTQIVFSNATSKKTSALEDELAILTP